MAATAYDKLQEYLHLSSEHLFDWFHNHNAAHSAPAASERVKSRTSSVRPTDNKTAREREALALAWQHRRGTRTHKLNIELDLLSLFEWVTAAVEEL
jgi:hypothetical protein